MHHENNKYEKGTRKKKNYVKVHHFKSLESSLGEAGTITEAGNEGAQDRRREDVERDDLHVALTSEDVVFRSSLTCKTAGM